MAPIIADYWERAEFPHHLVPKLAQLFSGGSLNRTMNNRVRIYSKFFRFESSGVVFDGFGIGGSRNGTRGCKFRDISVGS